MMLLPESLQLHLSLPSIFHLLIFSAILFQLFFWANHHLTKKKWKRLPSPSKLPIIGNLHQLGRHAHRSLKALSDIHGPLMLMQLGSNPCLIASSASAVEEILKTHDVAFSSRTHRFVEQKLLYNCKDIAVAPYGEYWRKAKGLSTVHLLSAAKVRSARAVRDDEVATMLEKISIIAGDPKLVNLTEMVREMISNFTSRTTLGKKHYSRESGEGVNEVLWELLELFGYINIGDSIPWFSWVNKLNGFESRVDKCRRSLDVLLERVLEDHAKGEIESGSFVDVLVNLEKENSISGGFCLGRDGLKAVILDMLGGGLHTVFTVVDWTMTELMRHPEVMAKAQAEVRVKANPSAISQGKAMIDEDDIQKMSYLKCVIKEVLRLHPPFPLLLPRQSISDVEIQGKYFFSKGTEALINCWAVAQDPEWWEKPEEFLPERFEVDNPPDYRGLDFQLIPFGGGRRKCPGINFASAVIECVVANLLCRFDFVLPEGVRVEDLDMTEATGLTTNRKSNLVLVVRPRSI